MCSPLSLCTLVVVLATAHAAYNGQLRLRNHGGSANQGLLQVFHAGRWGTVCDDWFTHRSAEVACRQMGFPGGRFYGYGRCRNVEGRYECGRGRIWMDDVRCTGSERRLMDCRRTPWGWHNCWHGEDVVVVCKPRPKWWIEWSFKDSTEKVDFVPGSYVYVRMRMKHRPSAQMLHYCWKYKGKGWRDTFQKNFKIFLFADDDGTKDYDLLKDYELRGVWTPAITREPYDLVDIIKRGVRCHDVMPWLKELACAGNEHVERVPIDMVKSQCWERVYEKGWSLNFMQSEWQLFNGTHANETTLIPPPVPQDVLLQTDLETGPFDFDHGDFWLDGSADG